MPVGVMYFIFSWSTLVTPFFKMYIISARNFYQLNPVYMLNPINYHCMNVNSSAICDVILIKSSQNIQKKVKTKLYMLVLLTCKQYQYLEYHLLSMCQVAFTPLELNVLFFNFRARLSSTPMGSISFIISVTKLQGT